MIKFSYIDTSAFVKYYGKPEFEKGCEKVETIVNKAREGESILISSFLMVGEVVSVFDKWVRIKVIGASDKISGRFLDEFVCSDDNLLRAAEKEGLNIFNPEK